MLIKTILNKCFKFKSFVYGNIYFCEKTEALQVEIIPRLNSSMVCSGCGKQAPGYDTLPNPRHFQFIPIWNIPVEFIYSMRRVQCKSCGIVVEAIPWTDKNRRITIPFMLLLANWSKALSWTETARRFHSTWFQVKESIAYVVEWGLSRRNMNGIKAIGIDEIAWKLGHVYLTLVYQLDSGCKRLLWIARDRTVRSLLGFFREIGKKRCAKIQYVCSDMWKPYLKVIRRKVSQAVHILDRFHIIQKINKAIDEIRAGEHRQLHTKGNLTLTHTRWCILKRPENLTEKQQVRLKDLLRYNLQSVRAYLLKEDFQNFWNYISPTWAMKFFDGWITRVLRSRLEPLKRVAKTLRRHRDLIMNWFHAKGGVSTGVVEGFNNKIKVTTRKSYGFRTYKCMEMALYHQLGGLPEPQLTHKFF